MKIVRSRISKWGMVRMSLKRLGVKGLRIGDPGNVGGRKLVADMVVGLKYSTRLSNEQAQSTRTDEVG